MRDIKPGMLEGGKPSDELQGGNESFGAMTPTPACTPFQILCYC